MKAQDGQGRAGAVAKSKRRERRKQSLRSLCKDRGGSVQIDDVQCMV